jgi:hypothetical protein
MTQGFVFKKKLLHLAPGSKLVQLLDRERQITVNGIVLVDRDPRIFRLVLLYLRNGLNIPTFENVIDKIHFLEELEYWAVPNFKTVNQLRDIFNTEPTQLLSLNI